MAEVQEKGVGLSWADIMNYAKSQFDELIHNIKGLNNKMKEQNEKWERDRCKLKGNKESDLNQVSDPDSGRDSAISLSTDKIIDDKVSANENMNNEEINDKVRNVVNTSENNRYVIIVMVLV